MSGLSPIESDIYITLFEKGPSKITQLSRQSKIPKTTLYRILERLTENALVTVILKGGDKVYAAENPKRLESILKDKKVTIEKELNHIDNLITKFPLFLDGLPTNTSANDFSVKFYEGKKSVKLIYEEALKSNGFRAFLNAQKLNKYFPENVNLFLETHRKRNDMHIWEIMEKSSGAQSYAKKIPKERYYCKFVPEGMQLSVIDFMMFDGKVAIVNLADNTSGTMVINESFYQNAKAIFDFVWQVLPEPTLD